MPQNNYLPITRSNYPLLRPYQKPPGITILTAITATYVPNKAPQPGGGVLEAPQSTATKSKSKK
jgi:hypothetical protein